MSHEVIRTINGRQYRYVEESYRVPGLRTPRKRSIYLGPVAPVYEEAGGHKRKKGVWGVVDELVRKKRDWDVQWETPEQERARIAVEEKERTDINRNNDLLTGETISLDALAEVAASQHDDKENGGAADTSSGKEAECGTAGDAGSESGQP